MKTKFLQFLRGENSLDESICDCRDKLYRTALSWCGDRMLADDLVQDTLSTAIRKQHTLRDKQKLVSWLNRILYRCWQQHLRSRKANSDIHDNLSNGIDLTERSGSREQICTQVRKAIYVLPIDQRQVVTLIDLQGCSYAEVSEILDVPIGTVMSRLSRARSTLTGHLLHFKDQPPQTNIVRSIS